MSARHYVLLEETGLRGGGLGCCLVDPYFNLLVGNMARKWCLKLIVCLAAGAMLELLLEIKGVEGAQNQLFNSEGKAGEHYPQFPMERN